MKAIAYIGGDPFRVELETGSTGRLRARVDDRIHDLELREVVAGVFRVERDGPSLEIEVREDAPGVYAVRVGGRSVRVEFPDRRARLAAAAGRLAGTATAITAPMPGKVVRVLVGEGDTVEARQGLVVIEAMKMQNEIRSPAAGRIARIDVRPGDAVAPGDPLIVLE